MYRGIVISLATLLLAPALFAQTNNSPIPIVGEADYGLQTYGNFAIHGPRLVLAQGLPQGPSVIGFCNAGAVCNLSFTFTSSSQFCEYCTGYSSGMVDDRVADYLNPPLTFTGSAFYSGGSIFHMRMKLSGTIVGYRLVGCTDGLGCNLGPEQFAVSVSGTAAATLNVSEGNQVTGASMSLTGVAVPVPPRSE